MLRIGKKEKEKNNLRGIFTERAEGARELNIREINGYIFKMLKITSPYFL